MYVSITGLKLRGLISFIRFWAHAIPAFGQSKRALGNLSTEARSIGGINYTLTTWESKRAMLDYVHSGVHRRAIKIFSAIATGKTYGYEAEQPPTWDEIPKILAERGRDYVDRRSSSGSSK